MRRLVKRLLKKQILIPDETQNPVDTSCQTTVDFSVFTVCVMGLVVDKLLNSFQPPLIEILSVSHIKLAKCQVRHLSSYLLILHISSCSSFLWQACIKYLKQRATKKCICLPFLPRLQKKPF